MSDESLLEFSFKQIILVFMYWGNVYEHIKYKHILCVYRDFP